MSMRIGINCNRSRIEWVKKHVIRLVKIDGQGFDYIVKLETNKIRIGLELRFDKVQIKL